MRTASASALMRRPRAEVFAFHADAANLSRVVPFGLIRTRGESRLAAGRTVALEIGIGPFTSRGAISVRDFDPPWSFVDVQRAGPFAVWEHTHRFTEVGPLTVVRDTVRFRLEWSLAPLEAVAGRAVAAMLAIKLRRTAAALQHESGRPAMRSA